MDKERCSLNEEMLMLCAYRYAIGRKSYVSSLAPYIGQKYYDLLSEDKRAFTANDIIYRINDILGFGALSIHYDGTVGYEERDALSDLLTWLNENVKDDSDLANIDTIECYKEGYGDKYPKVFEAKKMSRIALSKYDYDLEDLIVWHTLACFFNEKCHKKVLCECDGKEVWYDAFECWTRATRRCEDGFFRVESWKFKKCLMSFDHYKKNGSCVWLNEDYIKEVKKC